MALRDQPFIPLYVQDFLTDEKLSNCSAESTGVYIRVMCIMHKSEQYGKILLRQKWRQSERQISNFAVMLARQMPYDVATVERALTELLDEGVLTLDGDVLFQKRMVKDAKLSETRSKSGKKGAEKSNKKDLSSNSKRVFADCFVGAKTAANTENEIEDENEDENGKNNGIDEGNDLGRVMSFYMDKINPTPSRMSIDMLKSYTASLGADVVIHAFGVAMDERKTAWSYIQAILARYERDGLKTLDAVVRAEQEYREGREDRGSKRRSGVSEGGAKTEYVIHYDNDD